MTNYLVIAYRWGCTNGHQYIVYCGPDETKAIALADNEPSYRGGKYGTAVYKFNEDGTDYERTYYASSMCGEDKPYHNYHVDMFTSLGHRLQEYADGYVMIPDPKREGFLTRVTKRPPQWIKDLVEREKKYSEMKERILGGKKKDTAEGEKHE